MKVDDEGYSWRQIGPAMSHARPVEMLRAGFGVFFGLVALELVGQLIGTDGRLSLFLIAPFGATAFLLFAVPNAPLAQPWSATVGNTVSALAALAAIRWVADPFLLATVAVGAAVVLMHLARALHPPGGAVALSTVLAAAMPNRCLIISGGAILDFYAGRFPRAPGLMRAVGIEWLFRLACEPRRLFRRYVIGNPRFIGGAVRYAWLSAVRRLPSMGGLRGPLTEMPFVPADEGPQGVQIPIFRK